MSFLPGETVGETLPWPAWAFAEETVAQAGRWLRGLHDATADFRPPEDAVWFAGQTWRPGLVIGHHDAAPYNAVWRDGALVGFVDWDTAGPSSRELDPRPMSTLPSEPHPSRQRGNREIVCLIVINP